MRRLTYATIFALVASLITGCSSGAKAVTDLSVQEFASEISKPGVQILDVRTPAEFAEGHLANAINIDFEANDFAQQIKKLDKNSTYAVYCRSGRRSALAADQMSKVGFKNLFNMSGGILDWSAAGFALIK